MYVCFFLMKRLSTYAKFRSAERVAHAYRRWRELAAYGELLEMDPAVQARYFTLLDQLERDEPNNGLVQAAPGSKAQRAKSSDSNAKAIAHLTKAVDLGCSSTTVYADLAEALSRDGRLDKAVDVLNRGISNLPAVRADCYAAGSGAGVIFSAHAYSPEARPAGITRLPSFCDHCAAAGAPKTETVVPLFA